MARNCDRAFELARLRFVLGANQVGVDPDGIALCLESTPGTAAEQHRRWIAAVQPANDCMVRARSGAKSDTGCLRRVELAWYEGHGVGVREMKHKIYAAFRDASMDADGDLRVSDESGESYLYPADRFVPIDVPEAVGRSMTAQC
jgi:hypothetical protein